MPGVGGFSLRSVVAGPADSPILRGVSVDLPTDGVTVVVGRSGSGKSTMLRLLNRLDDPVAGGVIWRGEPVSAIRPQDLRRQVATVFQRPPIFPGTVLENLRVALPEIDEPRALAALDRVGLGDELLHREASSLSGGEAQRMCVARALLTDPVVLLADEATAALDLDARLAIEALARRLADDGLAVIWVTHDTAQVRRLADHVVALADGLVVAAGTLQRLDASDDERVRRLVGTAAGDGGPA